MGEKVGWEAGDPISSSLLYVSYFLPPSKLNLDCYSRYFLVWENLFSRFPLSHWAAAVGSGLLFAELFSSWLSPPLHADVSCPLLCAPNKNYWSAVHPYSAREQDPPASGLRYLLWGVDTSIWWETEAPVASILRKGWWVLIPDASNIFMDLGRSFCSHFTAASGGVFGASQPWRGRFSQAQTRCQ